MRAVSTMVRPRGATQWIVVALAAFVAVFLAVFLMSDGDAYTLLREHGQRVTVPVTYVQAKTSDGTPSRVEIAAADDGTGVPIVVDNAEDSMVGDQVRVVVDYASGTAMAQEDFDAYSGGPGLWVVLVPLVLALLIVAALNVRENRRPVTEGYVGWGGPAAQP